MLSLSTTSGKVLRAGLVAFVISLCASSAFAADPGLIFPASSEVSDQKAGSVLVYNIYTSSSANPERQNTRFTITNTSSTSGVSVHLFFVDGGTCSIADRFICLSPNQTSLFTAAEQDPGKTGYLIAIATDGFAHPIEFDHLIGDGEVIRNYEPSPVIVEAKDMEDDWPTQPSVPVPHAPDVVCTVPTTLSTDLKDVYSSLSAQSIPARLRNLQSPSAFSSFLSTTLRQPAQQLAQIFLPRQSLSTSDDDDVLQKK